MAFYFVSTFATAQTPTSRYKKFTGLCTYDLNSGQLKLMIGSISVELIAHCLRIFLRQALEMSLLLGLQQTFMRGLIPRSRLGSTMRYILEAVIIKEVGVNIIHKIINILIFTHLLRI
jgi:hypothetical protein